ncbi:MAG: hypothetical protein NZ518_01100, partial [Dehalococcoidia bacterium]|nr:hypothetical protein [Dehalococcoidia bacterium]
MDLTVAVAVAGAALGGFWQIAFTGRILASYDLLTYFYPYREVVNQALREGRVPLWNPDIFFGAPLLANIQTAVFYPPHLLTIWL